MGVAKADFYKEDQDKLYQWIDNKHHASMHWIDNRKDIRSNIKKYFFSSKSVISLAINYFPNHPWGTNDLKISKLIKYGKLALMRNPRAIFKKGRTIKFHFDMHHGNNFLDKAIQKLDKNERDDFYNFVTTEVSYNRSCMFICRSKDVMDKFYNSLFPWLERCEEIFGFTDNNKYNETRIF